MTHVFFVMAENDTEDHADNVIQNPWANKCFLKNSKNLYVTIPHKNVIYFVDARIILKCVTFSCNIIHCTIKNTL